MLLLLDLLLVIRFYVFVVVVGDVVMIVYFWLGCGLNSGIKVGIVFGDEICYVLRGGKFVGLELKVMKEYNDFIMKFQNWEYDKWSIFILNLLGLFEMLGWLLDKVRFVFDEVVIEW